MAERVTIEQIPHIKVTLNNTLVAESAAGYVIHEQGLPDRYYVPRADIKAQLADGTGSGTCPWKGEWKHLDVTVNDQKIANGAWTYFESKPATAPTKDMVAFYESKFQITR